MSDIDQLQSLTDECELFTLEGQVVDAKVVRVKDGDTILCCFSVFGMQPKKWCIRLLGIDACEVHTKDVTEKMHGLATSLLLENKISGKIVQLHFGPADKYGRLLATVMLNGENINEYVILNSPSVPYDGGHKNKNFNYNCESLEYGDCVRIVNEKIKISKK